MPLKVLLIGLGRWGQVHLKTWKQLGADLLLCDASDALLEQARPSAKRVAKDYLELLDEADVVDVVTPAPSHKAIVERCLEAGKDVHCEKPLTLASDESYALAELAETRGRLLQVGHVFRFEPSVDAVRELIRSGKIGRPRSLAARFMGFKRPRNDGGVAVSDGIHFIDLCSYLLEKQPHKVNATLRDFLGRGMDDAAMISLDYGREWATIEANYFTPEKKRDLVVMGESGAIVCDMLAKAAERVKVYAHAHAKKGAEWTAVEGPVTTIGVADEEPLRRELADFVRCHETRSRPSADGYAGAHAVAAIEAAERSAREGRAVAVEIRHPAYAN
ncbi:MAG TPA: Gfo/Idh/MocA family oxidoreductase [Planctomycetota bacterium]|nr:Gfo/Idh/MocA family oxidoreductase [Planctomycetota bacterium]